MTRHYGTSLAKAFVCLFGLCLATGVAAQSAGYPSRPVKMIVPYPPGGQGDIYSRILGKKLGETWGQQVVIENRVGAGGTLGVDLAVKAPPDGYTLGMGDAGPLAAAPSLYPKLPYDPLRDLKPVSTVAVVTAALAVNAKVPAASVRELIELARSKKGSLTYGAGHGAMSNLAMELLKSLSGADIMHVPYNGFAPAFKALLAGEIDMTVGDYSAMAPMVKAGKLRVLASTASKRSAAAPQLPTMAEAGVEGYAVDFWAGIFVPGATPADIVDKLNSAIVAALNTTEVRQLFAERGYTPTGCTPEQFSAMLKSDIEKYARVIKNANIKLQ
jgi:tripartite-type tricarboxylate transporter receptor subunit TctC